MKAVRCEKILNLVLIVLFSGLLITTTIYLNYNYVLFLYYYIKLSSILTTDFKYLDIYSIFGLISVNVIFEILWINLVLFLLFKLTSKLNFLDIIEKEEKLEFNFDKSYENKAPPIYV